MAAILRSQPSFKPDLVQEIEYNTTIRHAIPYIVSFFFRRSGSTIDGVMTVSKFDLSLYLMT